MGIRLQWRDRNVAEESHRVYRSETPMDPLALPTPLATLGPDVDLYDDGTVETGKTYYYRVAAVAAGIEALSDEISVKAEEITSQAWMFTIDPESKPGRVNQVNTTMGLRNGAQNIYQAVTGARLYVESRQTSGETTEFDADVEYDLPWPYSPIVDSRGDYTSRFDEESYTWIIGGLTPGGGYALEFTGSRSLTSTRNLIIEIDGEQKEIDASMNSTRAIPFYATADANGDIEFIHRSDGTNFSYFSALYIYSLTEPATLRDPTAGHVVFSIAEATEANITNRVAVSTGIASSLDVWGDTSPIGLTMVSETANDSYAYDSGVDYMLGWAADPIFSESGDYTVRFNSGQMDWQITGLEAGASYRVHFTGARSTSGTRRLTIEMNGQSQTIDASYNETREIVYTATAEADGTLAFSHVGDGSNYNYLSAIYIEGPL